jgi:DNA-binding NarL/FixJ family response regulator
VKRVFIGATSSAVVRAGLESLLATSPALTIVGAPQSHDKGERISVTPAEQIREFRPDVVIAEFEGRDHESLENFLALLGESEAEPDAESPGADSEERGAISIVILADEYQGALTEEAARAGVKAILPRSSTGDEIIAAVEAAAAGLFVLSPDTMASFLNANRSRVSTEPVSPASKVDALTEREIEVLGMLAEGLGNKTIAHRLGISEHTVKFHVSSVLAKLGAGSRTEAVTIGIRQGLILI